MAWIEKLGPRSWRVRYPRDGGGYGSVAGFDTKKAALDYANALEADRRRGSWLDPNAGKITIAEWAPLWLDTLDVETRTDENYRSRIRNHILPRWGTTPLADITGRATALWIKQLRNRRARSTVDGITTVFGMMLDDAVDERLIAANPLRHRPKRGRRREHQPMPVERIWATPEQVIWVADQAVSLSNDITWLLIVTTAWTGARWGEMTGLHRRNTHPDDRTIAIDPDVGCLHEGAHGLWLGPPKTPSSARTITLPPFLAALLREHLKSHDHEFVFTTPRGCWLRRSDFVRRVFRPAVDGNLHLPTRTSVPIRSNPGYCSTACGTATKPG
ncbi:MAG: hypothetical protein J2P17_31775 [Mycobacterium sp.]|nr:hypothetical protein [Mycobacterium sp.]